MLDPVRWETIDGRILDSPESGSDLLPGYLRLIDQTLLPVELSYLRLDKTEQIFDAIRRLAVRGAPAIGCAAALGSAAVMQSSSAGDGNAFLCEFRSVSERLASSRPTAVNLFWALNRCACMLEKAVNAGTPPDDLRRLLLCEGLKILAEDIAMCRAIGEHGVNLINPGCGVLTHCNAGALATGDYGTALSPMYVAHERGISFRVYADETRPLLQGSRLSSWELQQAGIDVTVICDNMAAQLMREGKVDLVIVGADRVAANGDAANKIGTYGVAVLAAHHNIPFYVAIPYSTVDLTLSDGNEIPIEQRDADEVRRGFGRLTAPADIPVYNPAFDVTPHELIAGIITNTGLVRPPFTKGLKVLFEDNQSE